MIKMSVNGSQTEVKGFIKWLALDCGKRHIPLTYEFPEAIMYMTGKNNVTASCSLDCKYYDLDGIEYNGKVNLAVDINGKISCRETIRKGKRDLRFSRPAVVRELSSFSTHDYKYEDDDSQEISDFEMVDEYDERTSHK